MATMQTWVKPTLFIFCLLPLSALVWRGFAGDLGANPVETITHETGEWALRFLLITLLISPVRHWTGNATIIRFRRMFGLYVFFYAFCHFMIWLIADHSLDMLDMLDDIIERPYISFGFSAFIALIPLAATSNKAMIKRLGKCWKSLHKLTYLVAVLVILHIVWLTKADFLEAGIYAVLVGILLLVRVKWRVGKT
ncbi:MAG: sulfoxide reductase heme-binding subunit YedZ [Gammaproteobacteria bacterium]|nr:sulfoxide reductase heme-binding subunit YedZ [Gammaproteobacteria bacterium]